MLVPVLILHGAADENSPFEGSPRAASRIPGAELVTFKGADHYMIFTKAPEIRERIRQFVGVVSQR
jgi:pimeloyl-ACP methyl ester carboxylesterase